jgi:hypothetical protein
MSSPCDGAPPLHCFWTVDESNDKMAGYSSDPDEVTRQPTQDEMRSRVVDLVFGGDATKFDEFCAVLREALPQATAAVLRGSAVTGARWKDGAPFDAEGPGTSDLDLTLVGAELLQLYSIDGFYVPGIHTKPLSDEDPDIAPDLVPLRQRLMAMVRRPVNIQATRDFVMYLRGDVLGQPYLTLIGKADTE